METSLAPRLRAFLQRLRDDDVTLTSLDLNGMKYVLSIRTFSTVEKGGKDEY